MITNDTILKAVNALPKILTQDVKVNSASATDVIMSLVPIIGIVFGVSLLFFYFFWQYRLKKELIKTNQYKVTVYDNLKTITLLMGCLSTFVGLPMTILFFAMYGTSPVVLGGLIPFAAGLGFLVFYGIARKQNI